MTPTPKQAQIAALLAQGMTAEQIAAQLHRSVGTVRRHIVLACKRVGARNTVHLVATALSRGWIAPLLMALTIADLSGEAMRTRTPTRTRTQVSASRTISRRDLGSVYA